MVGTSNKVTVKKTSDVNSVISNRPELKITPPTLPDGNRNEGVIVAAANVAQDAPTIAMQNAAAKLTSLAGTTKGWLPMTEPTN